MCIIAGLISKPVTAGNLFYSGPSCVTAPQAKRTVSLNDNPLFDWRHYAFRADKNTVSDSATDLTSLFEITRNGTAVNHLDHLLVTSDQEQTIQLKNISGHMLYSEFMDSSFFHFSLGITVNFWGSCLDKKRFTPDETCELSYQSQSSVIPDNEGYFWLSGVEFTGSDYVPFAQLIPVYRIDPRDWKKIIPPFKDSNGASLTPTPLPIYTMATTPIATVSMTNAYTANTNKQLLYYRWTYTNSPRWTVTNWIFDWSRESNQYWIIPLAVINTGEEVREVTDSGRSGYHTKSFCQVSAIDMKTYVRVLGSNSCKKFQSPFPTGKRQINSALNTSTKWLFSMDGGLYITEGEDKKFTSVFVTKNDSRKIHLLFNSGEKIYAGIVDTQDSTRTGLYKINMGDDLTDESNWKKTALSESDGTPAEIYTLLNIDGWIYAGTDKGLYRQQTKKDDDNWDRIIPALNGKKVRTLLNTGESVFVGTEKNGMYRSNDNGQSWSKVDCDKYNIVSVTDHPEACAAASIHPDAHPISVLTNFHQNIILAPMDDYYNSRGYLNPSQSHYNKNYRDYTSFNNGVTWAIRSGITGEGESEKPDKHVGLITGQIPWLISVNNKLYLNSKASYFFDYARQSWRPVTLKLQNSNGTESNFPAAKILSLTDILNISDYTPDESQSKLTDLPVFITTSNGVFIVSKKNVTAENKLYRNYKYYHVGHNSPGRFLNVYDCTDNSPPDNCSKKQSMTLTLKPFGTVLDGKPVNTFNYLPFFKSSAGGGNHFERIQDSHQVEEVTFFAGADDGLYKIHYDRDEFVKVLLDNSANPPDTNWQKVNGFQVGAVRALERTGKRIYAATEKGLFFTTDGNDWHLVDDSQSDVKISGNKNIVSLRYTGRGLYAGTKADGDNAAAIYYTADLKNWHVLPLIEINKNSAEQLSPNKVKECRIMYRSGTGLFVSLIPKPANANDADAKGLWMIYRPEETATYRPFRLTDTDL